MGILNSMLLYMYDNYQNQIANFIQDITKLFNLLLKIIHEVNKNYIKYINLV